jgi:hypothetical protein
VLVVLVLVGLGGIDTGSCSNCVGTDTWFDSPSVALAKGGQGTVSGLGGQASECVGDVAFDGGNSDGANGGGSAGSTGAGTTIYGSPLYGGNGGTALGTNGCGRAGGLYGAGGGAGLGWGGVCGGSGADGLIVITYFRDLCTENWTMVLGGCVANQQVLSYTDVNLCGTTADLPVNNGSIVSCSVIVGGNYRGTSGSEEVSVPSTNLITGDVTGVPSSDVGIWSKIAKFFTFAWFTDWWYGGLK